MSESLQVDPGAATRRMRETTARLKATPMPSSTPEHASLGSSTSNSSRLIAADIATMESDLARRQESYATREAGYVTRMREMTSAVEAERRRDETLDETKTQTKFEELRGLHSKIVGDLDSVKGATQAILSDQEKDLMRAFRARLFEAQSELDREETRKQDDASAWIVKARQLEAEADWASDTANALAAKNAAIQEANARLKRQHEAGEADRSYLLEQLVTVKKDSAALTMHASKLEAELAQLRQRKADDRALLRPRAPATAAGDAVGSGLDENGEDLQAADEAYEASKAKGLSEVKRVKSFLADQQQSLREVRHAYAAELASRTALQRLLRQCLVDVRTQIATQETPGYALDKTLARSQAPVQSRSHSSGSSEMGLSEVPTSPKSLALLRSQDRVVSLLYHKTFPVDSLAAAVNTTALGTPGSATVAPQGQRSTDGGALGGPGSSAETPSRAEVEAVELTQQDVREALGERADGEFVDLNRWPNEVKINSRTTA